MKQLGKFLLTQGMVRKYHVTFVILNKTNEIKSGGSVNQHNLRFIRGFLDNGGRFLFLQLTLSHLPNKGVTCISNLDMGKSSLLSLLLFIKVTSSTSSQKAPSSSLSSILNKRTYSNRYPSLPIFFIMNSMPRMKTSRKKHMHQIREGYQSMARLL